MSKQVTIPGGTATLRSRRSELTPRQTRIIDAKSQMMGHMFAAVQTATRMLDPKGKVVDDRSDKLDDAGELLFQGGDFVVSEEDFLALFEFNDALIIGLLMAWSLPEAPPATLEELLDVPVPVYEALLIATADLYQAMRKNGDGFGVDAIEDKNSPFGRSDGSATSTETNQEPVTPTLSLDGGTGAIGTDEPSAV